MPHTKSDQALQELLYQNGGTTEEKRRQILVELLKDPEIAACILQAASTTPEGRADLSATGLLNSQIKSGHDHLISVLATAPDRLKEYLRKDQDLPFPLDLVENISEEQIRNLQRIFDLPDADKYTWWGITYLNANRGSLEDESMDKGRSISRELREVVPGDQLPEVFFLIAFSYLMESRKPARIVERSHGLWAQLNDQAKSESEALKRTVTKLIDQLERIERGRALRPKDGEGRWAQFLPEVTKWLRKHQFSEDLHELLEVAAGDQLASQARFEELYLRDQHYNPSGKAEGTTDWVYMAVDRVGRILGDNRCLETRDTQGATGLFAAWGLAIDPGALKAARNRRKQKGNMPRM